MPDFIELFKKPLDFETSINAGKLDINEFRWTSSDLIWADTVSASNIVQAIEIVWLLSSLQAAIPKLVPKPDTPCPDFKQLLFAHALKLRKQFKQRAAWTSAPIIGSRPSKLQSRNPMSQTI